MLTSETDSVMTWKFKGFSDESIKLPTTPIDRLAPKIKWTNNLKIVVKLKMCLKQDEVTPTHGNIANFLIVYELDTCSRDLST